ncbi:MAG TPA: HAD-IIIA family hydrolase [Planctomycetaceae bacterium]|nr:HAD-IIIA family hydrolase [Planctomycetaceae bacterium]
MRPPPRVDGALLGCYVTSYLEDLRGTLAGMEWAELRRFAEALLDARERDRQVFILGNGGSAATASHMAVDLGKGTVDRGAPGFRRFRAIGLADNTSLITALGNDLSYEDVFVEQLRPLLNPGDLVVAITASGNSPNVLKALAFARDSGAVTVGLLGFGGGRARGLVDIPVVVASRNYGIAEDFHVIVQHILTQYLRRLLAGPSRPVVFLDRDGVINQRAAAHSYITRWEDFRFIEGVTGTLRTLAELGFALVVVTNQQGVGKGILPAGTLAGIHERMTAALAGQGVTIDAVFCCPHVDSDGCLCRKPRPGLLYQALNELPYLVDVAGSVLIGDSPSDIEAGAAVGLRTILIGQEPATAAPTWRARALADAIPLLAAGGTAALYEPPRGAVQPT